MKKMLIVWIAFLAASVMACDAPNQSGEDGAGSESVSRAPVDPGEADEAPDVHSDTTTTGGANTPSHYDTVQ